MPWPVWLLAAVLLVLVIGVVITSLIPGGTDERDESSPSLTVQEQCSADLLNAAVQIADGDDLSITDTYGAQSKMYRNAQLIATYGKSARFQEGVDAAINDMSSRSIDACEADSRAASVDVGPALSRARTHSADPTQR